MKMLKCEICGGGLIKRDGAFVCEYCGTKYTTEEARKLISIQGDITVHIEKPDVKDILRKARDARKQKIWDVAQKLNDQAFDIDPTNWEVNFFRNYGSRGSKQAFALMKQQVQKQSIRDELRSLWEYLYSTEECLNLSGIASDCAEIFPEETEIAKRYFIPVWEKYIYYHLPELKWNLNDIRDKQYANIGKTYENILMYDPSYKLSYYRFSELYPDIEIPKQILIKKDIKERLFGKSWV